MDKLQRLLGEMCLLSDACANCVTGLITRSQMCMKSFHLRDLPLSSVYPS